MPPKKHQKESSKSSIKLIEIANIRRDGGTQPRTELSNDVVTDYAEAMKKGAEFPPVTVFFDGNEYWLADGFHRVQAKWMEGIKGVSAEVHVGTQRDAILYAVGANATHGLRRTNADKHNAVVRLLRDNEWSQWSNREIARQCQVDEKTVRNIRKKLGADFPHPELSSTELEQESITEIAAADARGKHPKEEKPPMRRRTKKQHIVPVTPIVETKTVKEGDTWKLGKSHYLYCGEFKSSKFQAILPSQITLLLFFPRKTDPWINKKPNNVQNYFSFYTSYGDDIDLSALRSMIESCLSTTTDADDPVITINLPDPLLFMLMESLYCHCYCAESSPQRCTDALSAWTATNQTVKKL